MPILAEGLANCSVTHCLAYELISPKAYDLALSSKLQGPAVCLIPGFGSMTLPTIIGGWPRALKGSRGTMPACEW